MTMSTPKLYHKTLFMPDSVNFYCGPRYRLHYTRHAQLECLHDKLGVIDKPPKNITFSREQVIEIAVEKSPSHAFISKIVVRVPYENTRDLILVVFPEGTRADLMHVGTCWTNADHDDHATLDKSKYELR